VIPDIILGDIGDPDLVFCDSGDLGSDSWRFSVSGLNFIWF